MNPKQTMLHDFMNRHPFASAKSLDALPAEKVADFLQTLSVDKNIRLLKLMNAKKAAHCLGVMSAGKSREVVENTDVSVIAALIRFMDAGTRAKVLTDVSANRVAQIKRQLSYLPNSVATLTESATVVNKEMNVGNAAQIFRNDGRKEEFYLYVIDLDGNFKGIVRLKELFLAEDQSATIEDLIITTIPLLLSDFSISTIAEHSGWFDYRELPVLDTAGKLVGKLLRRRVLEYNSPAKNSQHEIEETGNALGELFRIGINGLLQGGGK